MGKNSKISWTKHTFNPFIGCQHVSAGCDNCYAETLMDKRFGKVKWGPHGERVRTSESNWKQPLKWDKEARIAGRRDRVFCASLADWLDNKAPQQWRIDLASLIERTPNLDWLLLTKRPENFDVLSPWGMNFPENVWLGITAENQETFDRRWEYLDYAYAIVKFISYEPALGPLTLRGARPDWVICGGESGDKARYMNTEWARDLRNECATEGIPFFFKQMSGRTEIPNDLRIQQIPIPKTE